MNLVSSEAAEAQGYLFDEEPDPPFSLRTDSKSRRNRMNLYQEVDRAENAGANIFFAAEGTDRAWTPSSRYVSPCWTTDFDRLPTVRAD